MKLAQAIKLSPNVVLREVGEEIMLLDLTSGTYFGLDPVGSKFLSLIQAGQSPMQARDSLLETYNVQPEVLDADLESLLDSFEAHDIIQPAR